MALVLKKLWEIVSGYLMLGARVSGIERHVAVLNGELSEVDKKLSTLDARTDKIAEDVAYLRGRADR